MHECLYINKMYLQFCNLHVSKHLYNVFRETLTTCVLSKWKSELFALNFQYLKSPLQPTITTIISKTLYRNSVFQQWCYVSQHQEAIDNLHATISADNYKLTTTQHKASTRLITVQMVEKQEMDQLFSCVISTSSNLQTPIVQDIVLHKVSVDGCFK